MSSTNNSGSNANSNRGTNANRNRNENKKKNELFKGNVDGFGNDALTMQGERPRGMGANYSRFLSSFIDYIGRSISKNTGRTWAKAYIMSGDPNWEPPYPDEPDEPDDKTNKNEMKIYKAAMAKYESLCESYQETIGGKWEAAKLELWSTILGQCSPKLKDALRQSTDYTTAESANDSIWLLRQANVLSGGGRITGFPAWQRALALKSLLHYTQGRNTTLDEYVNEFKAKVKTFETLGGSLTGTMDEWTRADGTKIKTDQAMLVCLFLANANQHRYGECTRGLRNDGATGYVRYPASIGEAYTMLDEFIAAPKSNNTNNSNENVESYIDIDCSRPENEICLTSTKYEKWLIDALWVLLDTASTVTIFCNALFLKGIREAEHPVTIHTSGGTIIATLEGFLPFLNRWVAFHPDCLGNILSFRDVLDVHHVTMNSRQSRSFNVHFLRNRTGLTIKKVKFRPSGTGLFYFDAGADLKDVFKRFPGSLKSLPRSINSLSVANNCALVNATVAENLKAFSPRQQIGIQKAREIYAEVGRPSYDNFLRMLKYRQIPDVPIRVLM